jgi:hypothetical protein
MTEDTDPVTEGLRRAIAAADAANDAAEDVALLGKAQQDFVAKVTTAQKRATALATGATVGAFLSLLAAGLIYFRSVGDLQEAADLQVQAAKLVAEQVLALKEMREAGAAEQEAELAAELEALPAKVAEAVAAQQAGATASPDAGTITAIDAARDEVLAALAELDLKGITPRPAGEGAGAEAQAAPAAAGSADLTDIRAALARIEAGLLRLSSAPAAPQGAKPAATGAKSAQGTGSPRPKKPAPVAEPSPFSYP